MTERKKILELFDMQKDFFETTVSTGIERYRKGNAKITLNNKNGQAIPNTAIKIKQTSHEFRFGANLFMLDELESAEKNEAYKKYFSDVFNMATLPFYWDTLEPERGNSRYEKDSPRIYRRPSPELCLEFCKEHRIEPREHALAYDHFFPKWLRGADTNTVKRELERHFSEISERYADKIRTIEVTNEMEWGQGCTEFYDQHDYIEWCFKTAEKYFPNNQLAINEWTGLVWQDRCRATDKYYAYIEANMLKGARIDAVGMQYHLFFKKDDEYSATRQLLDPQNLYRHMELYSKFGKPLQITEITVPSYSSNPEDEEIQAELIEKLYSLWFSHPNTEQIIYWNLVDGYAFVQDPDPERIRASQGDMTLGENYYYGGLLRFDMSPKPAYKRIKTLTQQLWHTETELRTNEIGEVEFRGFYGDYDIEIEADGHKTCHRISLSKNFSNELKLTL